MTTANDPPTDPSLDALEQRLLAGRNSPGFDGFRTPIIRALQQPIWPKKAPEKDHLPQSTKRKRKARVRAMLGPSLQTRYVVFDIETTVELVQRPRFGIAALYGHPFENYVAAYKADGEAGLKRLLDQRCHDHLSGVLAFYFDALDPAEVTVLERWCEAAQADRRFGDASVRVRPALSFFKYVLRNEWYKNGAATVGANLPFDFGMLASGWAPARGRYDEGFVLRFMPSAGPQDTGARAAFWPNLQVKTIGPHKHFMEITYPGTTKRKSAQPKTGVFPNQLPIIDILQAGKALYGAGSLDGLCEKLGIAELKESVRHGVSLVEQPEYVDYCANDVVKRTAAAYQRLRDEWQDTSLATPIDKVYSEASIAKAVLRAMGAQSTRERYYQSRFNPETPDPLGQYYGGIGMAAFFGGWTTIGTRLRPVEVAHVDLKSAYPTVTALMDLARGMFTTTRERIHQHGPMRDLFERIKADGVAPLRDPDNWVWLRGFVQIRAANDRLPVRTAFEAGAGINFSVAHLEEQLPRWYAAADIALSILSTRRIPEILDSYWLHDTGDVADLRPYLGIDPRGTITRELIARRIKVQAAAEHVRTLRKRGATVPDDALRQMIDGEPWDQYALDLNDRALDSLQKRMKVAANSLYGVLIEMIESVKAGWNKHEILCYCGMSEPYRTRQSRYDEPGTFFDPELAPHITAGTRLLLAMCEQIGRQHGLWWVANRDTDSLFIEKPAGWTTHALYQAVSAVIAEFKPLQIYGETVPVFAIEKPHQPIATIDGRSSERFLPVWLCAIAPKRYCEFRVIDGQPHPIKITLHGLGLYTNPADYVSPRTLDYAEDAYRDHPERRPAGYDSRRQGRVATAPRWVADYWLGLLEALLASDGSDRGVADAASHYDRTALDFLADQAAIAQVTVSSWDQLQHARKLVGEGVRPFAFFTLGLSGQPTLGGPDDLPRFVAPMTRSTAVFLKTRRDAETGLPRPDCTAFHSLQDALRRYTGQRDRKTSRYSEVGHLREKNLTLFGVITCGKETNRAIETDVGEASPLDAEHDFKLSRPSLDIPAFGVSKDRAPREDGGLFCDLSKPLQALADAQGSDDAVQNQRRLRVLLNTEPGLLVRNRNTELTVAKVTLADLQEALLGRGTTTEVYLRWQAVMAGPPRRLSPEVLALLDWTACSPLEPVSQATAIKLGRLKTLLQGAPLRESEARSIRRLLDAPRARQKLDAGAPSRTENAAGLIAAARQDRLPLKRLARVAGISYTQCLRFERREAHATDAEVKALRAAVRTLKADPTNTTDKGAK